MKRRTTFSSWSTCRTSVCASLKDQFIIQLIRSYPFSLLSTLNFYTVFFQDPEPNQGCAERIPHTFGARFNWFSTPALFHRIFFFTLLSSDCSLLNFKTLRVAFNTFKRIKRNNSKQSYLSKKNLGTLCSIIFYHFLHYQYTKNKKKKKKLSVKEDRSPKTAKTYNKHIMYTLGAFQVE